MSETEGQRRATGTAHRAKQGLVGVTVYVTPEDREAIRDAAYLGGRLSIQVWASRVLAEAAAQALQGRERPRKADAAAPGPAPDAPSQPEAAPGPAEGAEAPGGAKRGRKPRKGGA